jgi:hypothetical protein
MNFDWVKVPKNKEEEKEQFDTLYHMLLRMSVQGTTGQGARQAPPVSLPMDEFTKLKMDILSNFRGGEGRGIITPLETCQGCDRSFYSKEDKERHLRVTPACREWLRQNLVCTPSMAMPFFSMMEEGFQMLLGPTGKTCRFCEKPLLNRRAQEKHLQTTMLCNRLAHHTFRSWYEVRSTPAPAPAPASASSI